MRMFGHRRPRGSLPGLLAAAVLAALAVSEFRLHWVESLLGAYLAATNAERPETGLVWEQGRRARSALSVVEQMAGDREAQERRARNAGSLGEVLAALAPGQAVILSAEHFRELYRGLPAAIAEEIISPFELLQLAGEGRWSRTYLERSSDGLMIYLLEPGNRVLRQFRLAAAPLALVARGGEGESKTLEQIPVFRGRIYPAERFFAVLAELGEEERRGALPQPERLLGVAAQIRRVGISDEALGGLVEVGFEIRNAAGVRVILLQGQDWAVWRLRARMEGRAEAAPAGQAAAADSRGP